MDEDLTRRTRRGTTYGCSRSTSTIGTGITDGKDYSPKEHSAIERANADTVALGRMRDLKLDVAPGMMYLFQTTALTDSLLRGVSLYELRILRNEVYARHGRRFETSWLRDYFKNEPWYTASRLHDRPTVGDREGERQNHSSSGSAAARGPFSARAVESRRRRPLPGDRTSPAKRDLRAARSAFKDPHLQSYFASQSWYHADPKFSLRSLTPIERKNVDFILAYEARRRRAAIHRRVIRLDESPA